MSERNPDKDILDRATDALRDGTVPPVPPALVERTQFLLRGRAAVAGGAAPARSPFRHPLFRVAAAVVLATCGIVAYLARTRSPARVETAHQPVQPVLEPDRPGPGPGVAPGRAAVADADVPGAPGAVHGRVRFAGPIPQVSYMSMADNAHCAAHHDGRVEDESVVVNADGTLRNVVVWVSGGLDKGTRFPPPREPAVLDQHGCVFAPHVVTVMAGQRLLVKNSDEFLHNVRAAASRNSPFNFAQPTVSKGQPLVFGAAERLFVKCDIHPWMSAFIHVMDNPFFAVTGDRGAFDLPGLPPGEYEVSAWHEVYGEQKQIVQVKPGEPLDLHFTFKPIQGASADTAEIGSAVKPACCETRRPRAVLAAAGM